MIIMGMPHTGPLAIAMGALFGFAVVRSLLVFAAPALALIAGGRK